MECRCEWKWAGILAAVGVTFGICETRMHHPLSPVLRSWMGIDPPQPWRLATTAGYVGALSWAAVHIAISDSDKGSIMETVRRISDERLQAYAKLDKRIVDMNRSINTALDNRDKRMFKHLASMRRKFVNRRADMLEDELRRDVEEE